MTYLENEKKNKNRFWKGVLVGALVTAFAGLVIVGIAAGISIIGHTVMDGQSMAGIIESSGNPEEEALNLQRIGNKLDLLEQVVDDYFLFEEDVDTEQMEAGIYKGMLAGLEDPYTTYYTAEEYRAMTEETEGVYCGIGVQVLDTLVSQYIRGEEGTFVDLTVLRDGEEISATVERRMVESVTVEAQLLPDKTGYVMVTQFDLVTADQFISAVDSLEKQGMERLVIDLRDNPGGVVDACVKMAAYLLPEDQYEGTILSTADKNGKGDRYYCQGGKLLFEGSGSNPEYPMDDGHELDMPIAVLINGMSASASEVFAGALRDYGMATLVGTTSFGKGIVQALLPLDDGSAVKVTIAHYYTPSGHDIHKKGLEPDVEIELELDEDLIGQYDVPLDRDNQVQKAIEVLKQ